jgi:DNA-binding protein H-NS
MAVDLKKLTKNQLDNLINQAEARKNELRREEFGKVKEAVVAFARSKGYSIEELFGKTRRARKAAGKRGTVAPKYRNPRNADETWTGRGKRPRWFQALLDAGKKETELLIKKK